MKTFSTLLTCLVLLGAAFAQTTVTATVVDANANPYANGTVSAQLAVSSGQVTRSTGPAAMDGTGFFSMSLANGTYTFTVCAAPVNIGPLGNRTPQQVCFVSAPIVLSGGSTDVSASLNASATLLGPRVGSGSDPGPVNTSTSGGGVVSNCVFGWPTGVQTAGTIVAVNNEVRYWRCLMTASITVGHASTYISTNPAGTMAMGYFSCTPPYAALTRFQVDSSTTGAKPASQTPVVIPRGCVIFAYTASDALLCPHTYVANAAGEIDAITPNFGTASGVVVAGSLPASLGTLTGSTSVPPYTPVVFFEY